MRGCQYVWILLGLFASLGHAEDAASASDESDLVAALQAYEGRWVGTFTVHSTASDYTETFPVEQLYWWKDGVLNGVSVARREGNSSSSSSKAVVDDGKFYSEVKAGEGIEQYFGVLHDGGLLWFSSNLKRTKDYQMKEFFVEIDGQRILKTEGFDTYAYDGGLAYLIYRGELKFVSESDEE
jgi:hypothetical protein